MTMLDCMERRIMVANQLTLTWGDYPGLTGRPNVITRFLISERGRQKREPVQRINMRHIQPDIAGFKDGNSSKTEEGG